MLIFAHDTGSGFIIKKIFFKDEITASFRRFGPLVVDWPHKAESKSYFPPKGYAFLLFQVGPVVDVIKLFLEEI